MKTRIAASRGIVVKALCILGICLVSVMISLQGSAYAADKGAAAVKGTMKYEDMTITYVDAFAIKSNKGNTVVYLDNQKIVNRDGIAEELKRREALSTRGLNMINFRFDGKGKLLGYAFHVNQGSSSFAFDSEKTDGIISKVAVSRSVAKGRVYTKAPLKRFEDKFTFDVTFDAEIAGGK